MCLSIGVISIGVKGALAWPGFLRERAEGREGKQRDLCLPLAYSATINNQKGTSEC